MAKPYESILAWQNAHAFVLLVYKITKDFPHEEKYGITSQFRRAAVSVPANIVEGYARPSRDDRRRFLTIAIASLAETEYYLRLSKDLDYIADQQFETLENARARASYMLNRYRDSIV